VDFCRCGTWVVWVHTVEAHGMEGNAIYCCGGTAHEGRVVADDVQAAWAVLSLLLIMTFGMVHRAKSHYFLIVLLEFLNWGMFLAVWISIAVNIGKHQWCEGSNGSGHEHNRPCNSAYTILAFAIVDWILFTVTFGLTAFAVTTAREDDSGRATHEKNTGTGGQGTGIRPSDEGTLRGEHAPPAV
jgi:hypothetical protein